MARRLRGLATNLMIAGLSCSRRLQMTTSARITYVGLAGAIECCPSTTWHSRANDLDYSSHSPPEIDRVARANARSVAAKRNNMFRNRIYRGMPTIVLLVVAGIIEFLAMYAFA